MQLQIYATRDDVLNHSLFVSVFRSEVHDMVKSDDLLGVAYFSIPSSVRENEVFRDDSSLHLEHSTRKNTEKAFISYEVTLSNGGKWFEGEIFACHQVHSTEGGQQFLRDSYDILYDVQEIEKDVLVDFIRIRQPFTVSFSVTESYRPFAVGDKVLVLSQFKLQQEQDREKEAQIQLQIKMQDLIVQQKAELAQIKQGNISLSNTLSISKEKINELQKILNMTKAKLLEEARSRARAHELAAALHKAKAKIEVDIERLPSEDPFDTLEISMAAKGRLEGEQQAQQIKLKRDEKAAEFTSITARFEAEEKNFLKAEEIEDQFRLIKLLVELAKEEKAVLSSLLEYATDETKLLVAAKSKAEVEAREREDIKAREARKKLALQLLDGGDQNNSKSVAREEIKEMRSKYKILLARALEEKENVKIAKDKLVCIQSDGQNLLHISHSIETLYLEMQQIELQRKNKLASMSLDSHKILSYDTTNSPDSYDHIYEEKAFHVNMDESEAEMFGMINHRSSMIHTVPSSEQLDDIYLDNDKQFTYYNQASTSIAAESLPALSEATRSISMDPIAPIYHSRSATMSQSVDVDNDILSLDASTALSPYGPKEKAMLKSLSTTSKSWIGGTSLDGGQAAERAKAATSHREASDRRYCKAAAVRESAESALQTVIDSGVIADVQKAVEVLIAALVVEQTELNSATDKVNEELLALPAAKKIVDDAIGYVAEGMVKYATKSLRSKTAYFKRQKQIFRGRKDRVIDDWQAVLSAKDKLKSNFSSFAKAPALTPEEELDGVEESKACIDITTLTTDEVKKSETILFDRPNLKARLDSIIAQINMTLDEKRNAVQAMMVACQKSIRLLRQIAHRTEAERVAKETHLDSVRSRREAEETKLLEFSQLKTDEETLVKSALKEKDTIEHARYYMLYDIDASNFISLQSK